MEINIKKVIGGTPENEYEASDKMIKAQQELIEALHILISILENGYDEYSEKKVKEFVIKFTKS